MKILKVIPLAVLLMMASGCSMTPEEWNAFNEALNSVNNYHAQQAQQLRSWRAPRITPLQVGSTNWTPVYP